MYSRPPPEPSISARSRTFSKLARAMVRSPLRPQWNTREGLGDFKLGDYYTVSNTQLDLQTAILGIPPEVSCVKGEP